MPNIKSAIRRVRRVKIQTTVNKVRRSKYKLAIKKMYTDNLTETGLFEWGESRMMTPNEIEEKQKKDLEARLKNY